MSKTTRIARRSLLPLASTAAFLHLGSCGLADSLRPETPLRTAAPAAEPATPAAARLAEQTSQFAARVEAGLEKAARDKAAKPGAGDTPVVLATAQSAEKTESGPAAVTPAAQADPVRPAEPVKSAEPVKTAEPAARIGEAVSTETHAPAVPAKNETPTAETTKPPAPSAETPRTESPATRPASSVPNTAAGPALQGNAVASVEPAGREPVAVAAMGSMAATRTPEASAAPAADVPLDNVLTLLRKKVQANPTQLQYALALHLLENADGNSSADATPDDGLAPADRKLVGELAAALQTLAAKPAAPDTTLAQRAAPLVSAARKWESEADLNLPRLVLASRVDSFGVYTPVETKFENGKRHVVIIYCEVANFSSKQIEEGWFQTRLAQQDSLITEDGLLIWRPNPEEVEDRSRNQRHDFYLVKKLILPDTLAIGKYTLRMSVTDKLTNKIAMTTIPIEIVAREAAK